MNGQVMVDKELVTHMAAEAAHLVQDVEELLDGLMEEKAGQRLEELESGRVQARSEKDFKAFLKNGK